MYHHHLLITILALLAVPLTAAEEAAAQLEERIRAIVPEGGTLELDAARAAALARERAERVLAAQEAEAAAGARARAGEASLWPQLGLQAGYGRILRNRDPLPDGQDRWSMGLSGRQLLFSAGRQAGAWQGASATRDLGAAELASARREAAARARRAVADALLAQASLDLARERSLQRADELRDAEARYQAGTVSQLDVRQARIALIQTEDQSLASRAELETSLLELARAVAEEPGAVRLAGLLARPEGLGLLIDAARASIDQGADLRTLRAQLVQQEAARLQARGATLPELSAVAEYSRSGTRLDDTDDYALVGLELSWRWDGGGSDAQREAAARNTRRLALQLADMQAGRRQLLDQLQLRLATLTPRIAAQEHAVELADRNYADARANYQAGLITLTRVGEASVAVGEAKFRLLGLIHAEVLLADELRRFVE